MPEPYDSLTKAQDDIARVRSFLRGFPDQLSECNKFGFFKSWARRIEMLSHSVGTLAAQVDRLAESVDAVCNVLKENDAGRPS